MAFWEHHRQPRLAPRTIMEALGPARSTTSHLREAIPAPPASAPWAAVLLPINKAQVCSTFVLTSCSFNKTSEPTLLKAYTSLRCPKPLFQVPRTTFKKSPSIPILLPYMHLMPSQEKERASNHEHRSTGRAAWGVTRPHTCLRAAGGGAEVLSCCHTRLRTAPHRPV